MKIGTQIGMIYMISLFSAPSAVYLHEEKAMRVIGGRAKGRKLKQAPGDTTRPIMDRVKENLFNILGPGVIGTRWLDLFAGTGAVGIEAVSRGAVEVVFTDVAWQAIRTIKQNVSHTGFTAESEIIKIDAFRYLRQPPPRPFDVIYVAPPQYEGLWSRALCEIDARPAALLRPEGIAIVQIDPREEEPISLEYLFRYDRRRYGNTQLDFYAWERGEGD
jgi:16S rRNA (guanine(966)-N(2))-methyltransferase RsmD